MEQADTSAMPAAAAAAAATSGSKHSLPEASVLMPGEAKKQRGNSAAAARQPLGESDGQDYYPSTRLPMDGWMQPCRQGQRLLLH